jgi:2-(1,2-epoxy-1,2-dihydrophenyl)acetyl-CoA isomerase
VIGRSGSDVSDPVLLEVDADGLARLTLNRPDASNALDLAMAEGLEDAVSSLSDDERVRAVLLTGAGARFCAGGDVRSFAAAGDDLDRALEAILRPLHTAVSRLASLGAPVVAAVHGSAAGAGLSLLAGADLVLAAESTKLVMAYTGIGLVPDGGSTWYLPRIIGLQRALDLALTNRVLSATEACEWGLVARVVADDALGDEALAVARSLAAGPTQALAGAKRLLRESLARDLYAQLAHESELMMIAGESDDGREGVAAFAEKRPPTFRGS